MNANTPEIIESYLKGELTGAEKAAFEAQLEQDPLFKSEIELQKDIINSIKGYRKNQLKDRLSNIDVSATSYFNIAALKIAVTILMLGMFSYGSYYFLFTKDENEVISPASQVKEEKVVKAPYQPEVILKETDKRPEASGEKEEVEEVRTDNKAEKETAVSINKKTNKEIERKEVVVAPNVIDTFEEKQILVNNNNFDNPVNSTSLPAEKITEVEIRNEDNKGKQLKYKYLNKKLYLYGDFSTSPYELIELNSNVGKKLFLFHNHLYYQLSEKQKNIAPLNPIIDSLVIEELDSLKGNKGN